MNNILKEYVSPDGKNSIVLFSRSGGATTGNSTQISLIKSGKPLKNEPGNLFITDEIKNIEIKWIDDSHVMITCLDKPDKIYKRIDNYNGITILYELQDQP